MRLDDTAGNIAERAIAGAEVCIARAAVESDELAPHDLEPRPRQRRASRIAFSGQAVTQSPHA